MARGDEQWEAMQRGWAFKNQWRWDGTIHPKRYDGTALASDAYSEPREDSWRCEDPSCPCDKRRRDR